MTKNTDFVHIYKLDVVKNALKAAIKMLSFEGSGIKINPTLIADRSPALFWSLVFQCHEKKIPCRQMLGAEEKIQIKFNILIDLLK